MKRSPAITASSQPSAPVAHGSSSRRAARKPDAIDERDGRAAGPRVGARYHRDRAVAPPFTVGVFGDNRGRMLDTHAVARSLTEAEFTPAQADAITNAVRLAAEHGNHVTSDEFKVGLAELRTEMAALDARLSTQIANVETRLIKWMVGTVITTAGLTVAILRFIAP